VQPSIHLTHRDHAILTRLIEHSPFRRAVLLDTLEEELRRATLIEPSQAAHLVQLGSHVTWETMDTGRVRTARLVLPQDVQDGARQLSVLTPVGCALIGMREGDVFTWSDAGRQWRVRVVEVDNSEAQR
jgi:regulator of nucleoside diphosphate kinase